MCNKLVCLACFGLMLGLVQPNLALALDPSLVGWWKLDETAGTVAVDSSASGNNGTVRGTPQWVDGQIDGALGFDSTTTYVDLPIGPLIKSLTDATIGVWVRWTGDIADGDAQHIFEFGSSGNCYMYLAPSTSTGGPMRFVIRSPLGGDEEVVAATIALNHAWHHVAVTIDSTKGTICLYLDGENAGSGAMVRNKLSYMGTTFYNWLGRSGDTPFFKGYLDDFYIFSRVLSEVEIRKLQAGGALARELAAKPTPADQETDVLRGTILQWTAGISANAHNVYFADTFEAVENADTSSPLLVSSGQGATTYDSGRLEFGRTYYWRVDEVNAPPDMTVFKGDVWSFTIEPYAYPIPTESITATASSSVTGRGPEKTIDGSGLDADDMHSTVLADMWQTAKGTTLPAWIQYEFDKPYRLSKMLVWNYNGESLLAIQGAKQVVIEHSMDGITWTQLTGISEFPMASGTVKHACDITVDFAGVAATYVKITAKSNYSGGASKQCGLSEVRLMAVPVTARNPSPEPDANNVDPSSVLSWRPGREAAHHRVYLSDQEIAVRQGTAPVHTTDQSQITGSQLDLHLGRTYYWRVDEVNDAAIPPVWPGDTWAFTTASYIVVDDFESYGNNSPNRPFQTWIDGVGFTEPAPGNPGNGTGAAVGHDIWNPGDHYEGLIMEVNIVNSGQQSLPLYYGNSAGGLVKYSQTDRTFAVAQDWTRFGITKLVVHFYGSPGNTGQLFVKINNTKIPYPGSAADIAAEAWTTWQIDLASHVATARSVSTLSIGVDGSGASGLLYIDDIWLK